jgi:hypothetical protein
MGREVRRVPLDWEHPQYETTEWSREEGCYVLATRPKPLYPRSFYDDRMAEYENDPEDYDRPSPDEHMPEFEEGTAVGWCMYETTSEGTPISPVFETPEELARWLADTGASTFASMTTTYENWLRMIQRGSSIASAVTFGDGRLVSGVDAVARTEGS